MPVLWGFATGERPGALQILGIACALLGMILISRTDARRPARRGLSTAEASSWRSSARPRSASSSSHSSYGDKAEPLYTVTVARTAAILTLLVVAVVARPAVRLRKRAVPTLVLVGVLIAAANILFTTATTYGYLSIVGCSGGSTPPSR